VLDWFAAGLRRARQEPVRSDPQIPRECTDLKRFAFQANGLRSI
jgi:hypothetical protein